MMTFLKTILIVLLVYFGLKFLIKLVTPYLMRYISKKAGQQFEQFFGNNTNMNTKREREGSISIDKNPSKNTQSSKIVGEYVEYEEVD
ncbi:DUF4834 family protein [Aequorivita sp. F47161]|uniref:DUF4834 family protein n=1 Tax=Aequorivita vitellina TaxID=2874475 RepID=A0A9X1U2W0_9FLAO|nr:DUF4834 family protein [Aequorivita vitellina]MCG2418968.1 DUF4834 family protein [Aequorivita vitellina]